MTGDLVPSNTPPLRYASTVKNETTCLAHLLNPLPGNNNLNCTEV